MGVWRTVRALATSARPGLWSRFEIALHVNTRRLWVFMLIGLVLHHVLLAVLVVSSKALTMWVQVAGMPTTLEVGDLLFPYSSEIELPLGTWATSPVTVWPLCITTFLCFIVPACFMMIFTETMSRVGVRRVQLLRGAAYMLPGIPLGVLLGVGAIAGMVYSAELGPLWVEDMLPWVGFPLAFAWPAIQVLRWRAFVRHYLRLPHSNWIALTMIIVLLLTLVTTFVVIGNVTRGF